MYKELIDSLSKFAEYCPFGNPNIHNLLSCLEIYTGGHQHFDQITHVSVIGPDDFANSQMGNILEALCDEPAVATFSDLSLQPRSTNNKKGGLRIVYVDKKLRHSEDFERLCGCLRQKCDRQKNDTPMVIIGRMGFIDQIIQDRTISLYLPPFQNHVPLFSSQKVEEEVKEVKRLIQEFWKAHLDKIKGRYEKFERIDWLKNQDEALWLPIFVIAEIISTLAEEPGFLQNVQTLAKQLITSKRHRESALCLEGRVLWATQVFIEEKDPIEKTDYYRGDKLLDFVSKMLDRPRLTLSRISQILSQHHIIKDSYRDRFDVDDKDRSGKKEKLKRTVQYTCYQLDKDELKKVTSHYMEGDENGKQ